MKYLPLLNYKYYIQDNNYNPEKLEQEYQARLNGYTTQKTNLFPLLTFRNESQTSQYPIFFMPLPQIQNMADQIRRKSKKIDEIASGLPQVATKQFLDSLLLSEIFYTNKIEGVKTNRVEISTVIQENNFLKHKGNSISHRRLGSTIKMYQRTQTGEKLLIHKLQDFRTIYNNLLMGEIDEDRLPNGQLFRDTLPNGEVLTIASETKVVHQPPVSEQHIKIDLTALIEYMNNDETPSIYKALVTHFFFENTHPFLDGNGRMGRYLLSSYLSNKFDRFTGFSVATAIHKNVQQYYKVFKEADKAENRADLTFFIQTLLKILVDQQDNVIENLNQAKSNLNIAYKKINQWISSHKTLTNNYSSELLISLLKIFAQSQLFTNQQSLGITDNDVIEQNKEAHFPKSKTKRAINFLTEHGVLKLIAKRPKQHEIQIL